MKVLEALRSKTSWNKKNAYNKLWHYSSSLWICLSHYRKLTCKWSIYRVKYRQILTIKIVLSNVFFIFRIFSMSSENATLESHLFRYVLKNKKVFLIYFPDLCFFLQCFFLSNKYCVLVFSLHFIITGQQWIMKLSSLWARNGLSSLKSSGKSTSLCHHTFHCTEEICEESVVVRTDLLYWKSHKTWHGFAVLAPLFQQRE